MLYIWSTADSELLSRTFKAVLRSFRPEVPEHQFLSLHEDQAVDDQVPPLGKGDVVLACGQKALDLLRKAKLAPKNKSLTTFRETPFAHPGGGAFLLTFDPYMTTIEFPTKEIIEWDVRLAVRLMRTGSLKPEVGDYRWVASLQPTIDRVEAKFAATGRPVDVSMDTETMGLHPQYPGKDLVSISFTVDAGRSDMLYLRREKPPLQLDEATPLHAQVSWLLTSPKVRLRMANGKYDLYWIWEKWKIECTNFKFDTMLVGTLLDENRSNSLNLHAKLFTPIGGYDDALNAKWDKSRMELIPHEDLRVYQGGDTDACQQVADLFRDELREDDALKQFYVTILHPGARAFEKLERRGVVVDAHKMSVLASDLRKVVAFTQNRQLALLPAKMRIKYMDRIDEQLADGKNPMLPSIIKEYFFSPHGLNLKPKTRTEKTGEPSLAKAHLRTFADNPQAKAMVEAMTEGDSAAKTLSTFVVGFLKHLRPDGLLHPSYMLFHGAFNDDEDDESGTVTGRLSAKDPAFQTLPNKTKWAKRIRECFIAPPGKVIVCIDYAQGELKVVACFAPEKTMIQAYLDGLDLHAVTGAKLAGVDFKEFVTWKDNEDKELAALFEKHRGNAKPANFGLLYGQMAAGFIAYAWANYGIKLTLEEGEKMRDAFLQLYPGLLDFHERQRNLVRIHQEVRSPLGRLRHLPTIKSPDRVIRNRAERQSINSPIQSTLADMMEFAIALIDDAFPNEEVQVVGNIHDALVAYIDEDKVQVILPQVIEIMSNLPLHKVGWKPPLKFTVDAEVGFDLASVKKWKKAG